MLRTVALVVALAVGASGCFAIDGTLAPDGSAHFRLRYYLDRHATFTGETKRLGSDRVHVESIRGIGGRQAIADIRVDDVARLRSAEWFRNVEVTTSREAGVGSVRVVIRSPYGAAEREAHADRAREHPEVEAPRITLSLPGPVLGATPDADVDGVRVTWRFPLVEFARAEAVELNVRYTLPATE
jgi:hypothetical protein